MKPNNDLNIYVAFHIFADSPVEASKRFVENTMEELFKNECDHVFTGDSDNGCEVIYKIQQPLLVSDKNNEIFFNKLNKLFSETDTMLPHFTQVNEEEFKKEKE